MVLARVASASLLALAVIACGSAEGSAEEPASGQASAGGHGHGHGHGDGYHHDFSDTEHFAQRFDDPERDEWQRPRDVIALMEIREGMTVVDLGAGTGYFLPHLSRAVGPEGRVIALDVEPNMVAHMRSRAEEAGLDNVEVREVAPDDPGLEADSVNRILIVNTWHHIGDRGEYTQKLARALDARADTAALYIVDFTAESPHGPPAHARIAPEIVADEIRKWLSPRIAAEELPNQYVVVGTKEPGAGSSAEP